MESKKKADTIILTLSLEEAKILSDIATYQTAIPKMLKMMGAVYVNSYSRAELTTVLRQLDQSLLTQLES